ncbi:MAG: hypothetical protein OEW83_19470, partial [Acidimicrobiia bacterium]|nr:hypothetical protein [Acidimicrobiia bacterium]
LMVLLAVPNVITGLWAVVDPKHWYDTFPGWAPELISALPPYNEHLATDAGAGLLASGVAMGLAAVWPRREVAISAAVVFLAFSLPHVLWHVANPADPLTSAENAVNDITLAAAVVGAGLVLLWQWHHSMRPSDVATDARLTEGVAR